MKEKVPSVCFIWRDNNNNLTTLDENIPSQKKLIETQIWKRLVHCCHTWTKKQDRLKLKQMVMAEKAKNLASLPNTTTSSTSQSQKKGVGCPLKNKSKTIKKEDLEDHKK